MDNYMANAYNPWQSQPGEKDPYAADPPTKEFNPFLSYPGSDNNNQERGRKDYRHGSANSLVHDDNDNYMFPMLTDPTKHAFNYVNGFYTDEVNEEEHKAVDLSTASELSLPGQTVSAESCFNVVVSQLNAQLCAMQNSIPTSLTFSKSDKNPTSALCSTLYSEEKIAKATVMFNSTGAKGSKASNIDTFLTMLEYGFTNNLVFHVNGTDMTDQARTAMHVLEKAHYLGNVGLCDKIKEWARGEIRKNPPAACCFFNEAIDHQGSDDLRAFALKSIQSNPSGSLIPKRRETMSLSPAALRLILSYEDLMIEELRLFRILADWSQWSDTGTAVEGEIRKEVARDLVGNHINLMRIKPSDLHEVVAPTGLVAMDQILDAYKNHAVNAEKNGGHAAPLAVSRGPIWETSKVVDYRCQGFCDSTELLECNPMKIGKHIWSIEVTTKCEFMWIGMACVEGYQSPINREIWLGKQLGGFVYGQDGTIANGGQEKWAFPQYYEKSILTFYLDLDEDMVNNNHGNLYVSIDGCDPLILYDNLLQNPHLIDRPAFVPAVSLRTPGAVRFLGFGEYDKDNQNINNDEQPRRLLL